MSQEGHHFNFAHRWPEIPRPLQEKGRNEAERRVPAIHVVGARHQGKLHHSNELPTPPRRQHETSASLSELPPPLPPKNLRLRSILSLFKRKRPVQSATFKARVTEFWDWFAKHAARFYQTIENKRCADLIRFAKDQDQDQDREQEEFSTTRVMGRPKPLRKILCSDMTGKRKPEACER
jgi:hypothetical protein